MKYDAEFEAMLKATIGTYAPKEKDTIYFGWREACKGRYKIGEEVEVKKTRFSDYADKGYVCVKLGTYITCNTEYVRPIPAWEPKDGEAVMFPRYLEDGFTQVWCIGVYHNGVVYFQDDYSSAAVSDCVPVDYSKIGRLCEEGER